MLDPLEKLMDCSLISITYAAQILGISCKTARNWLSAGKFPVQTVRIGGRRMLRSIDLIRYVNQLTDVDRPAYTVLNKSDVPSQLVKPKGRPRKS
jgi:predicted DNA-binding transcriptional regulator AlpA